MLVTFAALALLPPAASEVIAPVRTYNGVGRPFPIRIGRGVTELRLLKGGSGESLAAAKPQRDLAQAFPILWTDPPKGVLYLQAFRGSSPIGPAIVLQPMTNPAVATLDAATKALKFEPDEDQAFAGYRAWSDRRVVFTTTMGEMVFRMRPDAAPNTAWNLLELVRGGFYDGTIVHRVVAKGRNGDPFVIQGGDPKGTGSGGPGYAIPLENSTLPHDFGVISMARGTDPNTAGAQWFVALSRAGTARLDGKYAAFGQLVSGADVLRALAAVPTGKEDRPFRPPTLVSARLVPAPPYPYEAVPSSSGK